MKRIYQLMLMVAVLLSATIQLTAQVNGDAAKPLVSTAEKPIYYYIESAGGDHAGNVILPGDAVEEKLKHEALTDANKENAKWQIVLEDGVSKLKNAETGKYMSRSHTYADAGERFEVQIYADQDYYKIYNVGFNPAIAYKNNLLDRQGTVIPEMQWYFVVAPGSEENYNNGNGNYYTLYGNITRTDRKLNSITFKRDDQLLKTVAINQQGNGVAYFDKTAEVIEVKPGDALSISFSWSGAWMRNIAYVDWDKNLNFNDTTETELLGHNAAEGSGSEMTKSINYTVPADRELGEYRLRVMVDWFDPPHGTPNHVKNSFYGNGGSVTDFTLHVTNTPKPLSPGLPFSANTVFIKGDVISLNHPEGTTVKYTTDDTDPATSATAIEGTDVTVTDNLKLRAIAIKDGVNSDEFVRDIKTIDLTLGNEYYVVFQRYDGTLALEDMGDGVPMTTQTLELGKAEQRWTVSKGASGGLYKLTSVAGNVVYYNGSKFTVSADPAEDAEVDLRFVVSPNKDYTGYEIQRKASTGRGMNPIGGSQVGKEIGEWDLGDGGNVVKFLSTKGLLLAEIEKAQAMHDQVPVGNEFGQYPAEKKTDLQTAINTAQEEYDKPTSDGDLAAITAIQSAIDTFKATINDDVTTLISTNARKYKWYTIRSTANHEYAKDKVISSTGREDGQKFTFESKSEPVADAQLFRFELNATNDSVKLINKANGKYMAKNGAIASEGAVFALNVLNDGYSFNIQPEGVNAIHAQQANAHIVNWAGVAGSASAWVFDFAFEEIAGLAKPIVSTEEKPVYYYIESAADGSVVLSAGVPNNCLGHLIYAPNGDDGVQLKHDLMETILEASISVDNALWQIVIENGVTKLKNKGTGLVLFDARFGKTDNTYDFIAEPLSEPFQYRLRNSNEKSPAVAWYTDARGNYLDRWGSTAANSQVAWFFFLESESQANYNELLKGAIQADLAAKIENTEGTLEKTAEGDVPGKFTATARETLQAVIDAAQIVHDDESATIEQYNEEIEKLNAATNIYLQSGVKPTISDAETTKWYFLQGTRPANTYLTSTGEGAAILSKTIIPDDTQLWKFVENTSGTANGVAMINKATGEYLDANTAHNTAVNSVADMPENNLQLKMSDIFTDKVARFWIEHAEGSTPNFRLHAGNTSVLNWTGNAYDNSSWLILEYTAALKDFLLASINKANVALGTVSDGIVYTEENKADFTAKVEAAQAVYDNTEATDEELISAKTALDEAFVAYKETAVVNPELLLSKKARDYKWYWIRSTSTHAYAADKVISAETRAVGQKFTYEVKAEEPTDEQLFRVELTEDKTKVKSLINKAGYYMAADGSISETEITDNEFALELLSDGVSLRIKPTSLNDLHAQEANTHIVNWKGDAGSASAWSFDFALEETVGIARPVVSTEEKPVYYYIESAADGTVGMGTYAPQNYLGHVIYAPSGDDGVRLKHDLLENIIDASISGDNALWQLVSVDGVTKLQNKGTGLFMDEARLGRTTTTSSFIPVPLDDPVTQYALRNSNQKSPAVAWQTATDGFIIDRWSDFIPNSQVAWFFFVQPGCEANYQEHLSRTYRAELLEAIDNANVLVDGAISDGIVYTDENKATFTEQIETAQAVYDNTEATDDELTSAKATLDEAIAAYKETAVVNPELLLSANPDNHKWYWIRSTSTHAYATDKVISAGERAVGEKFTFEDKAESPADNQLFRVELNEDNTKIKNLINKAGYYMAADGSISETEIADNEFALELLSDGVSLRIKPTSLNDIHAQEDGVHIVNWAGDAGSASAWSFDFALELPTSTKDLFDNTYVIRVNNGIITVDGVTEFDVYSIAGQKVNHKAKLLNGIYIVKVKDFTKKIIVK